MEITAADVKRLREETDAPMMECRAALVEANGDFEGAKQVLREKGKAAAAKRADRTANEGLIAIASGDKAIAAIIVVCETDFVAKNEDFVKMVQSMADVILANGTSESASTNPGEIKDSNGKSLADYAEEAVAKIRENIQIKQAVKLEGGNYASYLHHNLKSAAIVELSQTGASEQTVGRDVAMQIVAFNPEVITKDQLPQERLKAEYDTQFNRAINEGKNEQIAKNIAEGRVNKEFIKSAVLMEQSYFKDDSKTVAQYVSESASGLSITKFIKLTV